MSKEDTGGNDRVPGIDTVFKGSFGCYEKIAEWQKQEWRDQSSDKDS